jgi:hypothetical protein
MSRETAIARAEAYFDSGDLKRELARRVAMPTESQNPARAPVLVEYLETEMKPALEKLGFKTQLLHEGKWPFLFAERREEGAETTVFGYGHGDVIRGLDDGWEEAALALAAHRARRPLVWARRRRQQGPARDQPRRARGGP